MRILVVEDDDELRDVLIRGLEEAGYVVDATPDGNDAITYLSVNEYGVCVLDWGIAGRSGTEVIAWARDHRLQTPVLMLTARDEPADRVRALDLGADDYLVKPFDYAELLARLRALLRRPLGDRNPRIQCGDLTIDPRTRHVAVGEDLIEMTAREFTIVELLAR